jgi:hypothetical protein
LQRFEPVEKKQGALLADEIGEAAAFIQSAFWARCRFRVAEENESFL